MIFVRMDKIIILHLMDDMSKALSLVSNEAFREIFQSMSEGIVMVDDSGKIVVANKIAEQLFGYSENELTGMLMENLLPERYRGHHVNLRKGFNAHPEPRRMGIGRDLTALRKDGQEFPVEISLSYTQVKGQLLVMAFISDISLRKKAEEALKQSEEQLIVYAAELEKKVQSRTEALHKTIQELEKEVGERKKAEEEASKALIKERELNDLKTKFVSIASHEFRTPLSTVLSSASLIKQYNEREEPDKVDKHVQRIKSSVNHLTSILNDFLSLGKLEEGVIDVSPEFLNVKEFLEEIKEEISSTLKSGQKLEIEYLADGKILYSDPKILRNILFNLISNASKYSDMNKSIHLKCGFEDGQFVFTISDEGIGIPKEDQKHLFERFFRASNAGNVQGTGLGLNIVRRYAEVLSGSISFESEYEKGSDFKVMIPSGEN
ncbi:MAG: PAS domain-containing sensor histidine kinase [Chryseolinea sp.]